MATSTKDNLFKLGTAFHRAVFTATRGRVAGNFYGMPVVMLTTTGRKSGKKRTTMLTSPIRDGERVVLIASYGGDARHPAWYLNLKANPEVEVTMEGRPRRMKARTATAEEKAELWPRAVKAYKGYGGYQERTDRDIPVVILEPAEA